MSWRLAESLKTLRAQINAAFPDRDKESDGSIGDTSHAARKSDHNPNGAGVVCAIDTDEDLSHTIHSIENIVSAIRASKDPRVNYIIYEKRITVPGSNLQQWKPYTGPSPHDHHFHISVKQDPHLYDDPRPWDIGAGIAQSDLASPATDPAPDNQRPVLKVGARGQGVRDLQKALGVAVDGDFGPGTHNAVVQFQREKGLKADGIVGQATWGALGV
jgi:murein L,D-transpeptidase YcbB/YkuD